MSAFGTSSTSGTSSTTSASGISGTSGTPGTSSGASRRRALIASGAAVVLAAGVAVAVLPGSASGDTGERAAASGGGRSGGTVLAASMNGANEVPVQGGPAVGDKDGRALEFVRVKGDKVSVTVTWRGTGRPTALHLHEGAKGANGAVKVDFTKLLDKSGKRGKGGKGNTVTGTVRVDDAGVLARLTADPHSFYANLHTTEFPGGAVRGQLNKLSADVDFRNASANFQASVVEGKQIYECKKADDGSGKPAFAQRDVRARLQGNIAHRFTAPGSGTPQWVAPDGSGVTGRVISKTPNGDGNIPELDLAATRIGGRGGLLGTTVEILRLNTVGGVQPTRACTPGEIVGVPYQADYVFVRA
ncbi:CHRD domain-containing protein [Streptomyces luteocolor]|uniref:CHRD domain-containing protein n=1 Tax=Streptomyces luteocolor TaxID=285500 RepID=UPI0009A094BE|nr:CHRD domain-containing protein [Streptomyces luteocolor]